MPRTGPTPSIVPKGDDQNVYLVVDNFGRHGSVYRETEVERTELETTITDLIAGQFNDPVRVALSRSLSVGRRTSQGMSPLKSKVAAISMVTTFRMRFGTMSIATPVSIGSSRFGLRGYEQPPRRPIPSIDPCRTGRREDSTASVDRR